jgi:DNA-binding transcriptional regulator LsrR (DeoR family)
LGGAKPKVTADMTKQMLRMHHSGKTQRDIARSMGLSEGYVSGFLRGRFKHNKGMTI